MSSDSKGAFAEEDGRAIFAMLDHQRLRSHGQNLLRGSRQIGLVAEHLGFGVVNQKHIDQLQCFRKLFRRALDPVIHGVAAGEPYALHVAADARLQRRLYVG